MKKGHTKGAPWQLQQTQVLIFDVNGFAHRQGKPPISEGFTMFSHLAVIGACHVNAWPGQFYRSVSDKGNLKFGATFQDFYFKTL